MLTTTDVFRQMDRPGQTRRETGTQSQGSWDTGGATPRQPGCRPDDESLEEVTTVKANLARFTYAVAIIASMALTLGAGIRWN